MLSAQEQALGREQNEPPDIASADRLGDFAAVVDGHWSAVFRLLRCLSGNTHDTEDLAQETFLRALRRRDSYQPGTRLRAWLLRIATNVYYDLHRKRRRLKVRPLSEELPGPACRPEGPLEAAEQGRQIEAALATLPETTRLVFHLRAQEELSFREIAVLLETTEEAARWHMRQARLKLLQRLQDPP
jgi:RNA polymerase sigma-70 factor (ECF subfamily)